MSGIVNVSLGERVLGRQSRHSPTPGSLSSPLSVLFGTEPADLSGLDPFAEGFGEELEVPVPPGAGTVTVSGTTATGT
ncbi:MAG: hypothetical protein M3400_06135 [Actinomycetota bacterium]|nr:hypothetical protein [Actinomycetota bacterium]